MRTDKYQIKPGTAAMKDTAVLSVEDDEEIQQQLSHFFKTKVKNFYIAFNGEQGLEAFKKYKPNIVVSDIRMPVMDGLAMSKAIKDIDKDIPIVLTTAYNKKEYLIQSNTLGINQYLLKPIDLYLLFNLIARSIIGEEQQALDGVAKCQSYDVVTCLVAQRKGRDKKVFAEYFKHLQNCTFCHNLYYQYREFDKLIRKIMVQPKTPPNLRLKITELLYRSRSS